MKNVKLILCILTIGLAIASCNKEVELPEVDTNTSTQNTSNSSNTTGTSTISYTDLNAESDTIAIGATTTVTATATGDDLTYNWNTDSGDIIGSGNQVTYGASGCCGGTNTVTCAVRDAGNHEEVKSITIVVQ